MNKAIQHRYSYRTIWSAEDEEHVGLCDEFSGLSWLEEDEDAALQGIKKVVHDIVEDMKISGELLPVPKADTGHR